MESKQYKTFCLLKNDKYTLTQITPPDVVVVVWGIVVVGACVVGLGVVGSWVVGACVQWWWYMPSVFLDCSLS